MESEVNSSGEGHRIGFRLRRVTKTYAKGQFPALDITALDICLGEITAILGYSAAGKSTLLNILGLLDDPDPGRDGSFIQYGDYHPYHRLSAADRTRLRRSHFGFIFQSHHLANHLSARANVAIPLAIAGAARRERSAKASRLLELAGIDDRCRGGALPYALSGGESLRVAVMRAMAHDPKVLFADEPTGSLDPITARKVSRLILAWSRQEPTRAVVLVSHNFHEAFALADRFVVLHFGKVILDGRKGVDTHTPDDLLQRLRDASAATPDSSPPDSGGGKDPACSA